MAAPASSTAQPVPAAPTTFTITLSCDPDFLSKLLDESIWLGGLEDVTFPENPLTPLEQLEKAASFHGVIDAGHRSLLSYHVGQLLNQFQRSTAGLSVAYTRRIQGCSGMSFQDRQAVLPISLYSTSTASCTLEEAMTANLQNSINAVYHLVETFFRAMDAGKHGFLHKGSNGIPFYYAIEKMHESVKNAVEVTSKVDSVMLEVRKYIQQRAASPMILRGQLRGMLVAFDPTIRAYPMIAWAMEHMVTAWRLLLPGVAKYWDDGSVVKVDEKLMDELAKGVARLSGRGELPGEGASFFNIWP